MMESWQGKLIRGSRVIVCQRHWQALYGSHGPVAVESCLYNDSDPPEFGITLEM